MTQFSEMATPVEQNPAASCFRKDIVVTELQSEDGRGRYQLYDPGNDIGFELGKSEYALARLFDGVSSHEQIALQAETQYRIKVSAMKLAQFESRLLGLNILSRTDGSQGKLRDPATGITYGPLKKYLLINLLKMNPQRGLDYCYPAVRWMCSVSFCVLMLSACLISYLYLGMHFESFQKDVLSVYVHGNQWLLWHFPVILTSIALHEFGHALACRHYKVQVSDFGIGIYLLLATGWVRPVQQQWSALPRFQRVVTILAGPLVSLIYAAVGVVIWALYAEDRGALMALSVVMIVASFISLIPTLLPMFNGDTYLAITELINEPRLRQRSFNYMKARLHGTPPQTPVRLQRLYWTTVSITCLGWVLVWSFVAQTLFRLFHNQ
ncbi:M50 family metallopeptidase [Pseudomonas capsici]|uniref:M50 family metallopeptidase n=1 Tax=Pseudomonas capsici TaxID=2810614 RepID=UPI0021F21671|nr:M50 family metallopeptidase [Pseudomonas capsici]MCV4341498.1 M50 family metallopeptidase [Pseudomonas capsici]